MFIDEENGLAGPWGSEDAVPCSPDMIRELKQWRNAKEEDVGAGLLRIAFVSVREGILKIRPRGLGYLNKGDDKFWLLLTYRNGRRNVSKVRREKCKVLIAAGWIPGNVKKNKDDYGTDGREEDLTL